MIKTQIIKEDNRPVAVILDYKEFVRLKDIEQDKIDYYSALEVKKKNKRWTAHQRFEERIGIVSEVVFL